MDTMTIVGGAIAGALTGIGGSMLSWWRNSGVSDERIRGLEQSLRDHKASNDKTQGEIVNDLKEAVVSIRECVTEFRVMAREQNVVNTMVTKTLESVVSRQEANTMQLVNHESTIGVIRRDLDELRHQSPRS